MTGIIVAEVHNVNCGQRTDYCVCEKSANHTDPHECRCGGQWTGTKGVDFVAVRLPYKPVAPSVLDPDLEEGDGIEVVFLRPVRYQMGYSVFDEMFNDLMEAMFTDGPIFRYTDQYRQPPSSLQQGQVRGDRRDRRLESGLPSGEHDQVHSQESSQGGGATGPGEGSVVSEPEDQTADEEEC